MQALKILSALAALAVIAGCVTVAQKDIRAGLMDIGFPEAGATCLANELGDRLEADDLRRLADVIIAANERSEFWTAAREAGNPEIARAAGGAALACALPQS